MDGKSPAEYSYVVVVGGQFRVFCKMEGVGVYYQYYYYSRNIIIYILIYVLEDSILEKYSTIVIDRGVQYLAELTRTFTFFNISLRAQGGWDSMYIYSYPLPKSTWWIFLNDKILNHKETSVFLLCSIVFIYTTSYRCYNYTQGSREVSFIFMNSLCSFLHVRYAHKFILL